MLVLEGASKSEYIIRKFSSGPAAFLDAAQMCMMPISLYGPSGLRERDVRQKPFSANLE